MIECDIEENGVCGTVSFAHVILTPEQVELFNKDNENRAHIRVQTKGDKPYHYLFKVYPEEDPTENAGPFLSREEATRFLEMASQMMYGM